MNTANIFDIQRASFVDGPGIRTTVFFKGCNLKCKWCHNPESQSASKQILLYKDKCTNCGKCKIVCPYSFNKCDFCGKCELLCPNDAREVCGKDYTVDQVVDIVLKDKEYYNSSNGGATLSGGECMLQIDFVERLLKKCKELGVHTAVDTAGNVPWEYFERILPFTDLFLYDIKCITPQLHIDGTGSSNVKIIENFEKLLSKGAEIIVRIPVVRGFNANKEEMQKLANYLNGLPLKGVQLLPYHQLGEAKWQSIGAKPTKYLTPSDKQMEEYKSKFNI